MDSRQDLEKFIQSNLFTPFFEDLYASVIKPAQDETERTVKPRPRGLDLRSIQFALIQGEKGGACKYSAHRLDKRGWKVVNHYAYFLLCVRDENTRSNEGILYGKGLSRAEIDNRVWLLLRQVAFDHSPSQEGKSKGASLLAASPESKPLAPVPVEDTRVPSAKAAAANRDSANPGSSSSAVVGASQSAAPSTSGAVKYFPGRSERVVSDLTGPDDEERAIIIPSSRRAVAASKGLGVQHLREVIKTPDVDDQEDEDIGLGTGNNPLDNAARMLAERTSDTMHIGDRW